MLRDLDCAVGTERPVLSDFLVFEVVTEPLIAHIVFVSAPASAVAFVEGSSPSNSLPATECESLLAVGEGTYGLVCVEPWNQLVPDPEGVVSLVDAILARRLFAQACRKLVRSELDCLISLRLLLGRGFSRLDEHDGDVNRLVGVSSLHEGGEVLLRLDSVLFLSVWQLDRVLTLWLKILIDAFFELFKSAGGNRYELVPERDVERVLSATSWCSLCRWLCCYFHETTLGAIRKAKLDERLIVRLPAYFV